MAARPLDIVVVGGGPAGLYFAVLAKQANPSRRVRVFERNGPDDTFGFGVVFSENTMGFLTEQDQRNYPEIMAASRGWDHFTVIHQGEVVRCSGVGFAAVERKRLLNILQEQARAAGVELWFRTEVGDLSVFDALGARLFCAWAERCRGRPRGASPVLPVRRWLCEPHCGRAPGLAPSGKGFRPRIRRGRLRSSCALPRHRPERPGRAPGGGGRAGLSGRRRSGTASLRADEPVLA